MNTPTLSERGKLMLATIQGYDRPDVIVPLMGALAEYGAYILDIGQSDIHSHLNLGILFQMNEDGSGSVLKDLFFKGYEFNIQIRFTPISTNEHGEWINAQGKNCYIIIAVARKMTAGMLSVVAGAAAEQGLNIDNIRRLTGRTPLNQTQQAPIASIEFSMRDNIKDVHTFQLDLLQTSGEFDMDTSFRRESMFRRTRRLICFDMDSTLIQTEVIDELAMRAGAGNQVKAITERATRGKIDFIENFTERVALLKGLDVSVMEDIAHNLPITEGCERLMRTLKVMGYKAAILSNGFTYFGHYLQKKSDIGYAYANELEVVNGKFTGRYVGDVVDGRRRADLLRLTAQVECVDLLQTVAAGGGANDLPMLSLAGLGTVSHTKPKVKAGAEQCISSVGLDGIFYLLGYKDSPSDERTTECMKDDTYSTFFSRH